MVINCTNVVVTPGTLMFMSLYDAKGNIIAMSKVPENLPLLNLQAALKTVNQKEITQG